MFQSFFCIYTVYTVFTLVDCFVKYEQYYLYVILFLLLQPKNKKKFIEKKNALTFHVVHRSQHDPLITDQTAPQHVLVPQQSTQPKGVSVLRLNILIYRVLSNQIIFI